MNSAHIGTLRTALMALTGLITGAYCLAALWLNDPRPFAWWLPLAFALVTFAVMIAASTAAGRSEAGRAWDELYHEIYRRAAAQAYWVSLGFFGVIIFAVNGLDIDPAAGFAALGTGMGAAYLALFVWHDLRAG